MNKLFTLLFLFVFLLLIIVPFQANTENGQLEEEEVFEHLESAFLAQVSLSEKGRSLIEVESILEPFFSEAFIELFIQENIVEEDGEYLTYGSDMARYYIPFFTYSDKTKIVSFDDRLFVVEYFPASTEGPVGYESHYEAVELESVEGSWKVVAIWYDDLPKEIKQTVSAME